MGNHFSKIIFELKTKILSPKLNNLHRKSEASLGVKSLSTLNFVKRQAIIQHAVKHSTFYREKYAGLPLVEDGMQTHEDFLALPPLTRDELRSNFRSIKADNVAFSNYRKARTSGTTSAPVFLLHDKRHPETPIRWRILNWWGIEPCENQAFIYRYKKPFINSLKNKALWWPTKRVFLAMANPSAKQLNKFVHDFNHIKPALVQGYVDVVFEFAMYLLDNDIKIHPPKMVWVTSAPLFEEQREIMKKAFGAPVCDQYGNTEILLIAAECPVQNGLHMMQDTVHIEFVDDNNQPVQPNTTGKILLTDLTNYAFPLIRYEIGDEGKYKDHMCSCGSSLPLMDNVRGRQSMNIRTPSGLRIRGEHIMAMFEGYMKAFKEIQLRQEANFSVCIEYVPRKLNQGSKEADEMTKLLMLRARCEIAVDCREIQKIQQVGLKSPLIISNLELP
ncbi:phenylacetate-CoA ligase [Arenibacter palladensis]|uniref:Phenylacetate-CoA ligase n=1 Tax=Arenibacter palladensis TaxID=237373 RepID=A0A1M5HN53_9FLAO|nr:phenylacetate-CoA ligase [Arenibacter palladensis]